MQRVKGGRRGACTAACSNAGGSKRELARLVVETKLAWHGVRRQGRPGRQRAGRGGPTWPLTDHQGVRCSRRRRKSEHGSDNSPLTKGWFSRFRTFGDDACDGVRIARRGDPKQEDGGVGSAISGRLRKKEAPAPCHGLFRGSGSHQKAHQQSEIMPGDMDQVALVNILTTAQPSSPHAAPIQDVDEGPLDDLGPLAHGLFADARLQTGAKAPMHRRLLAALHPTAGGLALHPRGGAVPPPPAGIVPPAEPPRDAPAVTSRNRASALRTPAGHR